MGAMNQSEIDGLVAKIKPHGILIGVQAGRGNKTAAAVIKYYDMVYRCPEHGAMVMCELAFDKWLKEQAGNEQHASQ